jgi:hypothetical protein
MPQVQHARDRRDSSRSDDVPEPVVTEASDGRPSSQGDAMTLDDLEEMGPIDYIVLEWPGRQPRGEVAPLIIDLVDRGIIRVLDVAFMAKREDGTIRTIELGELNGDSAGFGEFEGASSGLIGQDDLEEAAAVLEPGTTAAVLVWENRWAAPVAAALRRSGGQLVASGRIPIQAILASLEAAEAAAEAEAEATH